MGGVGVVVTERDGEEAEGSSVRASHSSVIVCRSGLLNGG